MPNVQLDSTEQLKKISQGAYNALRELIENPNDVLCREAVSEIYLGSLPKMIEAALGYAPGSLGQFLPRRENVPIEFDRFILQYILGREVIGLVRAREDLTSFEQSVLEGHISILRKKM